MPLNKYKKDSALLKNQIGLRLTDKEQQKVWDEADRLGLNEQQMIRYMIKKYKVKRKTNKNGNM